MKIDTQAHIKQQFASPNQARCFSRAFGLQMACHEIVQDLLELDNGTIDLNRQDKVVVIDRLNLKGKAQSPIAQDIEKEISGTLLADETLKVTGNGCCLTAVKSHGFLGLGQERWTINAYHSPQGLAEEAIFFADGSIEYSGCYPRIGEYFKKAEWDS